MVLKLLPALPEDALQITYLFWDAMYPEDPFICMIYPQGPVPEAMEHVYKENYPYFSDPIYKQFKIVDTDIGKFFSSSVAPLWPGENCLGVQMILNNKQKSQTRMVTKSWPGLVGGSGKVENLLRLINPENHSP